MAICLRSRTRSSAPEPVDPGRRAVLKSTLALGVAATLSPLQTSRANTEPRLRTFGLTPGLAETRLLPDSAYPPTRVWAYNGSVPAREIRVRQGERIRVELLNRLPQPTTVHWHGLRLPNAMDGVPDLTQAPVAPGERFVYEYDARDAGTYWFHPHFNGIEQVARGLHGVLVVEEPNPPAVDRELTWIVDDWRLEDNAQIADDFTSRHDRSHGGRLGNLPTVNGRVSNRLALRPGERLRLRLVNVANARTFPLVLSGLPHWVIAVDGQPLPEPVDAREGLLQLAPGNRMDLIVDAQPEAGVQPALMMEPARGDPYTLVDISVDGEPLAKGLAGTQVMSLPANVQTPFVAADSVRHVIDLGGGAMDPKLRRGEVDVETVRARVGEGRYWTVSMSPAARAPGPEIEVARGTHVMMELHNDTMFPHPMHLHGHHFQLLDINGQAQQAGIWRDTILVNPGDRTRIGFVAEAPGDWLMHCHILAHHATGMRWTVRVV